MTQTRSSDGLYHINGKTYKIMTGSRAQVWNKTAHCTSGGLTRKNLFMNKWGRIVSAKKHRTAKKEKRLEKAGFFAKKGKFGFIKKNKKTSKKRGGAVEEEPMKEDEPMMEEEQMMEEEEVVETLPEGVTDRTEEREAGVGLAGISPNVTMRGPKKMETA